jgi:hypothetical protein
MFKIERYENCIFFFAVQKTTFSLSLSPEASMLLAQ